MTLPIISRSAKPAHDHGGGCHSGGCGSGGGGSGGGGPGGGGPAGGDSPSRLPQGTLDKIKDHPCYSEQAHHYFARMHVAVAPACNIQCNYCNRKYDCSNESRPGVVSKVLTPEQASSRVMRVAEKIPQLTVVGIAGPGDPLANPERTFATMETLAARAPDIRLCLSTNGLTLPEHVERIAKLNVDHVTITINCIDAEVGAKIYPWVYWNHRRLRGAEGAAILIDNQMKGLSMLTERGILVKVNSVMIPGINDEHLEEVSREVKARGAFLHNVMPLIAEKEHGTYFGVMEQRGPTNEELADLQDKCADSMDVMRHCRQCRADAVGLLGEDRGAEFQNDDAPAPDDYGTIMAKRKRVQDALKRQMGGLERAPANRQEGDVVRPEVSAVAVPGAPPLRIAVATKGHGLVNEHLGHANEFLVYEVTATSRRLIGPRAVDRYCTGTDDCGDHDKLGSILRALSDCSAVLCSKIGQEPWSRLEEAGITPNSDHGMVPIEEALASVYTELAPTAAAPAAAPVEAIA